MKKFKGKVGEIRTDNKFGAFKVIKDLGNINNMHKIIIQFLDKNMFNFYTEIEVSITNAIYSNIFDPYKATINNNTACRGLARVYENGKNTKEFNIWSNMIKNHDINEIDYRWRCLEYFCKDLPYIMNYNYWVYNTSKYSLYRVNSNLFSLNTTIFLDNKYLPILNTKHPSGYRGVSITSANTFQCNVNGDYYGQYKTAEAAANKFNLVAKFRGYPDIVLNNAPKMSILDIERNKTRTVSINGEKLLYRLLDPKKGQENNG